jgi:hypothetical protein
VLYAATARLCISDRPECVGHEYMEDSTEHCEVTVHIDASGRFPEMGPWCVTATGTRLSDTFCNIPRLNRINSILIPLSCNFFSGSPSAKNSGVKRA